MDNPGMWITPEALAKDGRIDPGRYDDAAPALALLPADDDEDELSDFDEEDVVEVAGEAVSGFDADDESPEVPDEPLVEAARESFR